MTQALRTVRVTAKWSAAQDICAIELGPQHEDDRLETFDAGAHLDVYLPGLEAKQYSLSTPHTGESYRIAVLREPVSSGGSTYVHDMLQVGDLLQISQPKNHFPLVPGARRSILLAGGIGVTPLLAMAATLHSKGADFEFHYCTRSEQRTAFLTEVRESAWADRARVHFDDGEPDQLLQLAEVLDAPDAGTHLYFCGPAGFMDWITRTAAELGWPEDNVHFEYFAGTPAEVHDEDREFEIEDEVTGQVVLVPRDVTALHALLDAGFDVASSCEEGVCGSCQTTVISGTLVHRDNYLTRAERESGTTFLPCVSRCSSARLVVTVDA